MTVLAPEVCQKVDVLLDAESTLSLAPAARASGALDTVLSAACDALDTLLNADCDIDFKFWKCSDNCFSISSHISYPLI